MLPIIEGLSSTTQIYKSRSCSAHLKHYHHYHFHQTIVSPDHISSNLTSQAFIMHAHIPLALSLLAVSALAAPPHLEARKGAAPVGGPASAKVTIYSGYTCTAPNAVSLADFVFQLQLLNKLQASTHRRQRRNSNHLYNLRRHMHDSLR
jgi:hypothetical protein